jgi:branched-subunit amino acid transport protein
MTAWIALLVASVLTLALRAGPSLIGNGVVLPSALERANRFATPALMGALAARGLSSHAGTAGGLSTLVAVAVAVPVALRTRSIVLTVVAGAAAHVLAAAALG